jgi:hypothetical protein
MEETIDLREDDYVPEAILAQRGLAKGRAGGLGTRKGLARLAVLDSLILYPCDRLTK